MSFMARDRLYWPGGKTKCLTLSYDDGVEQDLRLMEMMRAHGVCGTFNLNPGLFGRAGRVTGGKREVSHNKLSAERVPEAYRGQEIAAHGWEHAAMFGMDTARCTHEILKSRAALEELLRQPVTGYAYAFGTNDDTIVKAAQASGIRYARTVISTERFDIPQDFLRWDPTCHHNAEKLFELAEEFLSDKPYFSFFSPAKLFYIWGHAYEFDQDDNWERMEELLELLGGRDDVWYATNGEIESYVAAWRGLIFSADSSSVQNPSATAVWLGSSFDRETVRVGAGETVRLLPKKEM